MAVKNSEKVVAIIVSHFPVKSAQAKLLDRLAHQVDDTILVSNSPHGAISSQHEPISAPANLHCLDNGNRHGLAGGLNLGIRYALDVLNADYLYLSDQDSLPEEKLITRLLEHHKNLSLANLEPVGAIGPSHEHIKKQFAQQTHNEPARVTDLISSGSFISSKAMTEVGEMDEQLFIDYVDTEWCYRATSMGYTHWVIPNEFLEHNLGNATVRIMGSNKPLHHNADRHYYIVRNSIYLWRQAHMPWKWTLVDIIKCCRRVVAYPLLSNNKWRHLRAVVQGITDGALRRMGER